MYKSFFIILVSILFNCSSHAEVKQQAQAQLVERDSLLKKYMDDRVLYSKLYEKRNQLTQEEYLVLNEKYLRRMRADGLNIWNAFPNDEERYSWLESTISWAVPSYYNFFLNRFDTEEKAKWDVMYPKMRTEYMSYLDKKKDIAGKFRFERNELAGDITYHKLIFQITGKKFDLSSYASPIINLFRNALAKSTILNDSSEQILRSPDDFGLDQSEILAFLKTLKEANIPELSEWVDGKSRMFKLKQEPLQLSFRSLDGKLIDIQQMKGKVILIDFWATWCSACLEYMPTVRDVYNKYHDQGLEVISVSVNKNAEKEQVRAVERKLGVSWPLGIIGDDKLRNDIWKKFAFTAVPQLILLDKDGKLIENNGKLMNEITLNEVVKKALE